MFYLNLTIYLCKAMIAAARVFNLIDRKPEIDSAAGSGLRLNRADGEMEFRGATFSYPNRTQVRVLRNLNLAIHSGKSVALGKAATSLMSMERRSEGKKCTHQFVKRVDYLHSHVSYNCTRYIQYTIKTVFPNTF